MCTLIFTFVIRRRLGDIFCHTKARRHEVFLDANLNHGRLAVVSLCLSAFVREKKQPQSNATREDDDSVNSTWFVG